MRVEPGYRPANLRSILRGIALRSHNPLVDAAVANKTVGEVNLFAARIGQIGLPLMRDYADDLHPLGFRRADADQQALADRRLIGEGLRSEQLIDDRDILIGRVVE